MEKSNFIFPSCNLKSLARRKFLMYFYSLWSIASFGQGNLEESKQELKQGDSLSQNQKESTQINNDTSASRDFLGRLVLAVTVYSAIGKYRTEAHLHSTLSPYPYYENLFGNYRDRRMPNTSSLTRRLDIENQILIGDFGQYGNQFKLTVRPFHYAYSQFDLISMLEGKEFGNQNAELLTRYRLSLCYDRLRFQRFNLGWNIGANYITSGINEAGISLGLKSEFFLFKPVSFYSAINWSSINGVSLRDIETQCRIHLVAFYGLIGYRSIKINSSVFHYYAFGAGVYLHQTRERRL